jgi:hypothetical protein
LRAKFLIEAAPCGQSRSVQMIVQRKLISLPQHLPCWGYEVREAKNMLTKFDW